MKKGAAPPEARYLTIADLAARWKVSRSTIYRKIKEGYIRPPVVLAGGVKRWPLGAITEMERNAELDAGYRP